jgi:hypothetical protein
MTYNRPSSEEQQCPSSSGDTDRNESLPRDEVFFAFILGPMQAEPNENEYGLQEHEVAIEEESHIDDRPLRLPETPVLLGKGNEIVIIEDAV